MRVSKYIFVVKNEEIYKIVKVQIFLYQKKINFLYVWMSWNKLIRGFSSIQPTPFGI